MPRRPLSARTRRALVEALDPRRLLSATLSDVSFAPDALLVAGRPVQVFAQLATATPVDDDEMLPPVESKGDELFFCGGPLLPEGIRIIPGGDFGPEEVSVSFALSTNNVAGDGDDIPLGSVSASVWWGYGFAGDTLTLPENLVPGTYYLVASTADSSGVSETPEALRAELSLPDLTVDAADVTNFGRGPNGTLVPGSPVSPVVRLTNFGNDKGLEPTEVTIDDQFWNDNGLPFKRLPPVSDWTYTEPASVEVRFVLTADDVLGNDDDIVLGSTSAQASAYSRSYAYGDVGALPADLTPGSYRIAAIVDPDNAVEEADETNNTSLSDRFDVLPLTADIVVSSLTAPGDLTAGVPFDFATTIDWSQYPDYTGSEQFFLSADDTLSDDDIWVDTTWAEDGSRQLVIPHYVEAGNYFLIASVGSPFSDPELPETDYANNTASIEVTVAASDREKDEDGWDWWGSDYGWNGWGHGRPYPIAWAMRGDSAPGTEDDASVTTNEGTTFEYQTLSVADAPTIEPVTLPGDKISDTLSFEEPLAPGRYRVLISSDTTRDRADRRVTTVRVTDSSTTSLDLDLRVSKKTAPGEYHYLLVPVRGSGDAVVSGDTLTVDAPRKDAAVSVVSTEQTDTGLAVTLRVTNAGNVPLSGRTRLALSDDALAPLSRQRVALDLDPGESQEITLNLKSTLAQLPQTFNASLPVTGDSDPADNILSHRIDLFR